jgi:hypothetical protein
MDCHVNAGGREDLLNLKTGGSRMALFSKVLISLSFLGALSYAADLNGKLLDASCYDTSHPGANNAAGASQAMDRKSRENLAKTCAPTASTTSFAFLNSKGNVYKLDNEGNAKAAAALQSGSLKADRDGDMHASMSGSLQGDAVKVDSVHGRGEHK